MTSTSKIIDDISSKLDTELNTQEIQEWGAKSRSLQAKKRAKVAPTDNILESGSLKRLNLDWAFPFASDVNQKLARITSHRPGIIGQTIVKVKRKIAKWLYLNILQEDSKAHQDFNHFLVDTINQLAHRVVFLEDRISHLERDQKRRLEMVESKLLRSLEDESKAKKK